MIRETKNHLPRHKGRWIVGVFGMLGVVLSSGCSMFGNSSSVREKETIYRSDAAEKKGFLSPATGPKTTKQFLSEPRVPLPPQS